VFPQTVTLQEDCVGLKLTAYVVDGQGLPTSLADVAAVKFRFLAPGPGATVVERTAAVEGDAADGAVSYVTTDADLNAAGVWRYQVKATWAGGKTLYTKIGTINVLPNLA
jgi:hypothetical protein